MPVNLEHLRDEMLPGLRALQYSFVQTKEIYAANVMNAAFDAEFSPLLAAPPISLPAAVAIGAAAVVIKNPTVTRRFFSWFNKAVLE